MVGIGEVRPCNDSPEAKHTGSGIRVRDTKGAAGEGHFSFTEPYTSVDVPRSESGNCSGLQQLCIVSAGFESIVSL